MPSTQEQPTLKSKSSKPSKSTKRASPNEDSKPAKRRKTTPSDTSEDELSSPPSVLSDEEKPKNAKKPATSKATAPKPTKANKSMPKPRQRNGKTVADSDREERVPKPKSRQKKTKAVVESDEEGLPPPKHVIRPKRSNNTVSSDEDEVPASKEPDDRSEAHGGVEGAPTPKSDGVPKAAESGSEMSIILDPSPPPKKKRKSSETLASKGRKQTSTKTKAASKEDSNVDPDADEIKRLQGWLIKCGIRKMWHKELAPYETSKAKIRHLKDLLKDVGMDGRYSVEKARQIKEQRELAADLEMVQEGAKRWGADSEEEEEKGKPKRRLAKGLKELQALMDSDDDSG